MLSDPGEQGCEGPCGVPGKGRGVCLVISARLLSRGSEGCLLCLWLTLPCSRLWLTPPLLPVFFARVQPPVGLWRPTAFSHLGLRVSPFRLLVETAARRVAMVGVSAGIPGALGDPARCSCPLLPRPEWTLPSGVCSTQTTASLPTGSEAVCVPSHCAVTWHIGNFWALWPLGVGEGSVPASPAPPRPPYSAAWPGCPRPSNVPF